MDVPAQVFQAVLGVQLERGAWDEVTRLLDEMASHEAEVDAEVRVRAGFTG